MVCTDIVTNREIGMPKARVTMNKSSIKTNSMKTMDGVKQKPEKKDMLKPTKYPSDKVDKKVAMKVKK